MTRIGKLVKPVLPENHIVVGNIVDLDPAGVGVAQDHVGFAAAAEIAEAHDLPVGRRDRLPDRPLREPQTARHSLRPAPAASPRLIAACAWHDASTTSCDTRARTPSP